MKDNYFYRVSSVWIDIDLIDITIHWGRYKINAICRRPFEIYLMNENIWISIKISLKFFSKGPINNIAISVQKMAWWRLGDKPLSETMMVKSTMHICVRWPQWVAKIALNVKHHNVSGCNYRVTYVHIISRPVPKYITTKTKMAAIPQMTGSNAFSWMMYKNVDKNSLTFISRSPIDNFRHWFR